MNIWKRAYLSITRRKLNSLVLLLIVFILANVLLTTLAITNSLQNTKEMVLNQFPPVVNINYEYNSNDVEEEEVPDLTPEMADELYKNTKNIVKNYDYSLYFSVKKDDQIKHASLGDKVDEKMKLRNDNDMLIRSTQLPSTNLVPQNEAKLIQGKGFSETDIKEGKAKVIVSKQFANTNQLSIGSTLSLVRSLSTVPIAGGVTSEPFFEEELELEVVGILEINQLEEFIKTQSIELSASDNDCAQMRNLADDIYVPNNYLYPILKDHEQRAKEKYQTNSNIFIPGINMNAYPTFVLNNVNDVNAFVAEAKKVYDEKYFSYKSAASEYEVVAAPLDSMGDMLNIIFTVTVVASIIILTLVLYIFMYLRQKEMGILLALGEHRARIIEQSIIETLIVALIGATLAIFTSIILSNIISDNTVQQLLTPTKELALTLETMNANANYGITAESISAQMQNGLSIITFVLFYSIMVVTIFISQIATALYLMRLNPKKILM